MPLPLELPRSPTELQLQLLERIQGPRLLADGFYRTLLHNPPLAEVMLNLGTYLRFESSAITGRAREAAILAAALALESEFIWTKHIQPARDAGITDEQLQSLARSVPVKDELLNAVVRIATSSALRKSLDDGDVTMILGEFGSGGFVEIVSLAGFYAMVNTIVSATRSSRIAEAPKGPRPLADLDMSDPSFLADPYPTYHRLRRKAPVIWSDALTGWLVLSHAPAYACLRNPQLRSAIVSDDTYAYPDGTYGPFALGAQRKINRIDGEAHRALRAVVSKAFTPSVIAQYHRNVGSIARELMTKLPSGGRFDLLGSYANPLPLRVICELLGIASPNLPQLRAWSDAVVSALDLNVNTDRVRAADAAVQGFDALFSQLLKERREQPRGDLLSSLAQATNGEGGHLDDADLLVFARLLLNAGHETTTNLIGNGFVALMSNQSQLSLLRRFPDALDGAVLELLRYDSPVQVVTRRAAQDLEVGGHRVKSGDLVYIVLGAANRDPAVFTDPDRLDLMRDTAKHLGFGGGPHYCLGASLAQLEAATAFRVLLEATPAIELASPQALQRTPNFKFRGFLKIDVQRSGRASSGAKARE